MDAEHARELKRRAVEEHGSWTAHNIHLGGGVYTIADGHAGGSESRMRRAVQIVADLANRPFTDLRVADLGCLEGGFAVEFAVRGAEVLALDGREPNLAKVRVAKEALSLDRLETVCDDLRNFTRDTYGEFDVVLAFGVLYHLELAETLSFLRSVADACRGLAVLDTEIDETSSASETVDGVAYSGCWYAEPTGDPHDREVLWSSIGNRESFKPTRTAIVRALLHAGFTTAMECHLPPVSDARLDRATFVAVSAERQLSRSCPPLDAEPWGEVPEFAVVPALSPRPAGGMSRLWSSVRAKLS